MNTRQAGFTLVETIMVVVAGAMLAALLTAVMGNSLTRSSDAVLRQRQDFRVEQALAQVTRDYVALTNNELTRANALALLKANVDAGNYTVPNVVTVTGTWVAYSNAGVESVDNTGANNTLKVVAVWPNGRTMVSLYTRARPDTTTQLVWY